MYSKQLVLIGRKRNNVRGWGSKLKAKPKKQRPDVDFI